MSEVNKAYNLETDLLLGVEENRKVSLSDQVRQRREAEEILRRLRHQPGVILGDEVGMGKTFVALGVAYSVAIHDRRAPVVIMVPSNLIEKWKRDLGVFCDFYLKGVKPLDVTKTNDEKQLRSHGVLKYGTALHSVEFLRLLDDVRSRRCHMVFLAHGAMSRGLSDHWVRLALIWDTFRRYGRRDRVKLVQAQIHRFLGDLLWVKFRQNASIKKEKIWKELINHHPREWKDRYNKSLKYMDDALRDDPVPKSVVKALRAVDMKDFAGALEEMPVRARGGAKRIKERIHSAWELLHVEEKKLWKHVVAKGRWLSPLLILDEAHHLKNPQTSLARQLQSIESEEDLKQGDSSLSKSFERMLFLTATPFQLGHDELVRVLRRFGDVRWKEKVLGAREDFEKRLARLSTALTDAQLISLRLYRVWERMKKEDVGEATDVDKWWEIVTSLEPSSLTRSQRRLLVAFTEARKKREIAEKELGPWVIRHNKGILWPDTPILRRKRFDGANIEDERAQGGISIPHERLFPFFLAARSASDPGKEILGEALCSSYEAFRFTRKEKVAVKDNHEESEKPVDLTGSGWYLAQFDKAIEGLSGQQHPKITSTVRKVVDLWQQGEKVLVFAFYRQTCRALRIHISRELENYLLNLARQKFTAEGRPIDEEGVQSTIDSIQNRFFDDTKAPGRRALDGALEEILARYGHSLESKGLDKERLLTVMRRFLRVRTTLVRAFPFAKHDRLEPEQAVWAMLDHQDASMVSWRWKFEHFLDFLLDQCSQEERRDYTEAVVRTQTGSIKVQLSDLVDVDEEEAEDAILTLANIQVATGKTKREARSRLMLSFNTPFFPDILVCSQVMGEGIDLQRFCRHVIHHDLDWNPSSIEQRTGRVDRIGCKAEGRFPIHVYLPYLAGTADERQYLVMRDREDWFKIVMGQEEITRLSSSLEEPGRIRLPSEFQKSLIFRLALP
jgi:superfamily II DNA or RNA helicase